jgi:very-short-patch-repair endonuclease
MTDAEERLWYNLRRHGLSGYKFRRQHPLGSYILDFYCAKAGLVVEVDGGQHIESEKAIQDAKRTRYLTARGLRVLRFTNLEVLLETDAVLNSVLEALGPLSLTLSQGGDGTR